MEPTAERPPLLSGPRIAAVAAGALVLAHATWLVWPRAFLVALWLRWAVLGVLVLLVLVASRARHVAARVLVALLLVALVGPYVLHTGYIGVHLWRVRRLYAVAQVVCRQPPDAAARARAEQSWARLSDTALGREDLEVHCWEGRATLWGNDGWDRYELVDEDGTLRAW